MHKHLAILVMSICSIGIGGCSSESTKEATSVIASPQDSINEGDDTGHNQNSSETPVKTAEAQECSNPNCTDKAKALLNYLYEIKGSNILSGQKSLFWDAPRNTWFPTLRDEYIYSRTGHYPAIFSSDFGDFSGNSVNQRHRLTDVVKAYAGMGSIISLSYHLVQPDADIAGGFNAMHIPGSTYTHIDAILTEGTPLNEIYLERLDEVASYLSELQSAGIPVLWRPFHEMNGDWFWWSHQPRYKELWQHMWDYFTNNHNLDNLLWVYSVNWWPEDAAGLSLPETHYPGDEYVDILGVDIYLEFGHDYSQRIYDHLSNLAGNKPVGITENGEMPNLPELRESQPNWVFWSTWSGFERASHGNTDAYYQTIYSDASVLTQEKLPALY